MASGTGGYDRPGRLTALAAVVFVLPVAVSGFSHWSAPPAVPGLTPRARAGAAPVRAQGRGGVLGRLDRLPDRRRLPVYVNAAPPGTSRTRRRTAAFARRTTQTTFLVTGDLAIPRRYGAQFVVLDLRRHVPRLALPRLYSDARYALYRSRGRRAGTAATRCLRPPRARRAAARG